MNQIEKMVRLIASLVSKQKTQQQHQVESDWNAALSGLTGFDEKLFATGNALVLQSVLGLLNDDNKKALAAILLFHKDAEAYRLVWEDMVKNLNKNNLQPQVKALVETTFSSSKIT